MTTPLPHYEEGWIEVDHGHRVFWCAHGQRDKPVVVIVHGGPGGAMNASWGKFFDPAEWRIVFFDQRGCGRSTPFGETTGNTLDAIVGDMEQLREALGIAHWAIFGGSWGTTVALAYGIAHPARVTGFMLRGIFLARQPDIDWFLWGVRRIFPEAHDAFLDAIERADGRRPSNLAQILDYAAAPLRRFDSTGVALAKAWSGFEATLSSVRGMPSAAAPKPAVQNEDALEGQRRAVSMALLEHHYIAHELPAPDFLGRLSALQDHPCFIVHGRFDMVCPAEQATALAAAWPKARIDIVLASGHWTFEPGIELALFNASRALRDAVARPAI